MTKFEVNLATSEGGVMNAVFINDYCVYLLIHHSSLTQGQVDIKICQKLQFKEIFKMIGGFFFKDDRAFCYCAS